MTSTRTHADSLGDAALDELAAAGWPLPSRQSIAEWFVLTSFERAEAEARLKVAASPVWQRPPYPIDLLYVPSVGGVLPLTGPSSAQTWLASLQPKPGDKLSVFPVLSARYQRETINSMRGVGGFEQEPVIPADQQLSEANVVVEPNGLRVIVHFHRSGREGCHRDSGRSVHFLVPLRSVARIELRATWSPPVPLGDGSLSALKIGVSFNDGWRLRILDVAASVGERDVTEVNQLLLAEALIDAVAGAQGLPSPDGDLRSPTGNDGGSEVVRVIDFEGAIGFGVAASS